MYSGTLTFSPGLTITEHTEEFRTLYWYTPVWYTPFPRDWLSPNTLKSSGPCSDTLLCDTYLFSRADYHGTHRRVPDPVVIHSRRGVEESGEPDICDQFHRLLIRVLVLGCQGEMGVQCTNNSNSKSTSFYTYTVKLNIDTKTYAVDYLSQEINELKIQFFSLLFFFFK